MSLTAAVTAKMQHVLLSVGATVEHNWLMTTCLAVMTFFTPAAPILYMIMFTISLDFATGVWASRKRGEKFSSHRMRDTIVKLFLYCLLYLAVYGISATCFLNWPIHNFVGGFVLMTEAVSLAENVDSIIGGKLGLAKLMKKLKNKQEEKISEL